MTTEDEKGAQRAQMIQEHSKNPEEEEESMRFELNSMCNFSPQSDIEAIETSFPAHKDRNTVSLVCKPWYKVEAWTRNQVFIGNCYALSPGTMINRFPKIKSVTLKGKPRFPKMKSVTLKGKPRFAYFNLVAQNWGAHLYSWVSAMAPAYPWLEKLSLKRMTVADVDLTPLANSFPNFKELDCITVMDLAPEDLV